MQQRNVFAVHCPCNQRFVFHGLGNRNPTRDNDLLGVSANMGIGTIVTDINSVILEADIFENIAQADSCPFRTGNGSYPPLVAFRRRIEFGATIAPAFELNLKCMLFEFLFQLCD